MVFVMGAIKMISRASTAVGVKKGITATLFFFPSKKTLIVQPVTVGKVMVVS